MQWVINNIYTHNNVMVIRTDMKSCCANTP